MHAASSGCFTLYDQEATSLPNVAEDILLSLPLYNIIWVLDALMIEVMFRMGKEDMFDLKLARPVEKEKKENVVVEVEEGLSAPPHSDDSSLLRWMISVFLQVTLLFLR